MISRFGDGRDWFFERRYGMFVHWGLYSIPGWHEQQQWRASVPSGEYEKLAQQFNPTDYHPDAWLDLAEEAGMRYICLTTKHHDGYCLWDTAQTDYNVMNSPYGRDVVGMLAEACHRRDFPLCLYYSVVDWHQPDYPNQGRSHELLRPRAGHKPNFDKYREFLVEQVRELCTQYGEIHGIWWDMNVTGIVDRSINALIRSLQPKAVINNRGFDEGDFGTPERDMDRTVDAALAFDRMTEACQAVGRESWGYRIDEDYYSDRHLLYSIDKAMAKGANYLLNVGPMADGTIPEQSAGILRRLGSWYSRVQEAFLDAEPASHLVENRDVLLTRKGNTLYVHLHRSPATERVLLKPITQEPARATLLNTGEAVETSLSSLPTLHMGQGGRLIAEANHYLQLRNLPVNEHAGSVLVVKLEFDGTPEGLGE